MCDITVTIILCTIVTPVDGGRLAHILAQQLQKFNDKLNDFMEDETLQSFANSLYSAGTITDKLHRKPVYNQIELQFTSLLECLDEKAEFEEHCQHYIQALISVGGPVRRVAEKLRKEWKEKVNNELDIDLMF